MAHEPKKVHNNVSSENRTLNYSAYDARIVRDCGAKFMFTGTTKRKKQKKEKKLSKKELFFIEFAEEIDLFSLQQTFPEWVYDYREDILNRVCKEFRVMCQHLKDAGIKFYMKYPIAIDGKWKFADFFIPARKLVVLLLNEAETIGLPCHSKANREMWFSDRYKTLGICTYEVNRTIDKIKQYYGKDDK